MVEVCKDSCFHLEEEFYQINEKLISTSQKIKNSIEDFIEKLQNCHDNFTDENEIDIKMKIIFQFIQESQINENMKPMIKECNDQLEHFSKFYKEFKKTFIKITEKTQKFSKKELKIEIKSNKRKNDDSTEQIQEDLNQNENDNENKNEEKENLDQAIHELEQVKIQLQRELIKLKKEENKSKAKATLLEKEMNDSHIIYNNKLKDMIEKMENFQENKQYFLDLYNKKLPKLHIEDEEEELNENEIDILKMNDEQKVDYFNRLTADNTENRFNIKAREILVLTQKFETVNEDQFEYLIDLFKNKISKVKKSIKSSLLTFEN